MSIYKQDFMKLPYFAYGSNLDHGQMQRRCKFARPTVAAELPDYRLVFRGVADVEPHPGGSAVGGLWRITPNCLRALDVYEGFPTLYDRHVVTVQTDAGAVQAIVYRMTGPAGVRRDYRPPGFHYLDGIERGYGHFGLDVRPLEDALLLSDKIEEQAYEDFQLTPSWAEVG